MPLIWSADFETGDSSQYSLDEVTGSNFSQSVTGAAARNGSWGSEHVGNETTNTAGRAQRYYNFTWPSNNTLYCSAWIRFTSFTSFGFANSTSKGVIRIGNNGSGDATGRAFGLVIVGTRQLQASVRTGDGTSEQLFGNTVTLALNAWMRVKLLLDKTGSNPVCTWWTSPDGTTFTQQGTFTDTTTGTLGVKAPINRTHIGLIQNGMFEPAVYTIQADDHRLDDSDPDAGGGGGSGWGSLLGGFRNRAVL